MRAPPPSQARLLFAMTVLMYAATLVLGVLDLAHGVTGESDDFSFVTLMGVAPGTTPCAPPTSSEARLCLEPGLEAVGGELIDAVERTVSPRHRSLWLREP